MFHHLLALAVELALPKDTVATLAPAPKARFVRVTAVALCFRCRHSTSPYLRTICNEEAAMMNNETVCVKVHPKFLPPRKLLPLPGVVSEAVLYGEYAHLDAVECGRKALPRSPIRDRNYIFPIHPIENACRVVYLSLREVPLD